MNDDKRENNKSGTDRVFYIISARGRMAKETEWVAGLEAKGGEAYKSLSPPLSGCHKKKK